MIINGQSGAIEQPQRSEFDQQSGWRTIRTFKCIGQTAATAIINQLTFQGYTISSEEVFNAQSGSLAYITVQGTIANNTLGGAEVPQDNYELSVNKVQKDLLDADHPMVNQLNETNRDELRQFMQDPSAYVAGGSQFSSTVAGGSPADASWVAVSYLWKLVQAGVRHIEVRQPIFRLNRYVSQNYNTAFVYNRVGKILTTATVKAEAAAPANFLISLDQITAQYFTPTRSDGLLLNYGWLKESPTLSMSYASKKQIQQEYVFGLWDTGLHGLPI